MFYYKCAICHYVWVCSSFWCIASHLSCLRLFRCFCYSVSPCNRCNKEHFKLELELELATPLWYSAHSWMHTYWSRIELTIYGQYDFIIMYATMVSFVNLKSAAKFTVWTRYVSTFSINNISNLLFAWKIHIDFCTSVNIDFLPFSVKHYTKTCDTIMPQILLCTQSPLYVIRLRGPHWTTYMYFTASIMFFISIRWGETKSFAFQPERLNRLVSHICISSM